MTEKYKKFWYYAGEWHDAECDFVLEDQGVCNCDTKKNRKFLENIELESQRDIYSILGMLEGSIDRKKIVNYIKEYLIFNFNKKL